MDPGKLKGKRRAVNSSSSRDLTSPQSISLRRETQRDDEIPEPAATPVIVSSVLASPRTSARRKAAAVPVTPVSSNIDAVAHSSSAISRQMSFARQAPLISAAPLTTPPASLPASVSAAPAATSTTPSRRQLAAAAMAARIARGAASASDSELSGGTVSGTESSGPAHTSASSLSSSSAGGGSRRNLLRAPSRAVLAPSQAAQAAAPIALSLSKPRVPRQQRAPVTAASPAVRSLHAPLPPSYPTTTTASSSSSSAAAPRGERTSASARPPRAPSVRQQPFPEDQDDVGAADIRNEVDNFYDDEENQEEEEEVENEEFATSFDVENDDDESVLAIPEKATELVPTRSSTATTTSSSSSSHKPPAHQQQQQLQRVRAAAEPTSISTVISPAHIPTPILPQHKTASGNSAHAIHQVHSPLPQSNRAYQNNVPALYNDLDYDDVDEEEEEEEEEAKGGAYSDQANHVVYSEGVRRGGAQENTTSTHLIYDDFTDELDSSVNLAHAPATHLASSSVSPCGGQVIYGVASEEVNPLGSATMDFPQSALHLQQQQQQKQLHRKESKHRHAHPALARLASVRATQGKAVVASRYNNSADAGPYGCESSSDDDDNNEIANTAAAAAEEEDIDAIYEDEEEPQDDYSKKVLPLSRQQQQNQQQQPSVLAPTIASGVYSGANSDCGSTESSSAQTAEALRRHKSQARLERYGDAVHAAVRNTSSAPPLPVAAAASSSSAVALPPPSSSSRAGDLTPPRSNIAAGIAAVLSVGVSSALAATPRAASPPSALRQRHSQPRRTPPSATAINVKDVVRSPAMEMDENPTSSSSSSSSAGPIAALSFEEFTANPLSSNPLPDSPPLPVPAPLFNLRVNKRREAYRPSTSLNEDDYDYAIVVRAVVTRKQEAGLAKAKAQADSIAAAARANAALFGVPSVFESTRTPEARNLHTVNGGGGGGGGERIHAASSSKMVRGTSNLSETGGGFNSSSLRIPTPGGALAGASKSVAMRSVAEENDDDDENNDGFADSSHSPARDSASESDSDSGTASENEGSGGGEGTKGRKKGEDESWYNEWDNEDSDGEEEEEEEGGGGSRKTRTKNEPESKSSKLRSRSADAPSSRRRRRVARKSILDTITGIAERGIARVRMSLGGGGGNPPSRSASTPSRKKNKTHVEADDTTTSKKSVKFESHKSEAVITVLPRSPDITNSAKHGAGRVVAFADKISSPNLFARSALSPSGVDDDLDDDAQGGDGGGKVHKCAEILSALRTAGLEAKRVRSLSRRTWLIKIRCLEWRLEIEAEKLRLRMRRRDGGWSKYRRSMRNAFVPAIPDRDDEDSADADTEVSNPRNDNDDNDNDDASPSGASKASKKKKARAVPGKERPSLFHSSDRQTLIDHILRSSAREGGAELGTGSPLGAYVTHMFPLHMHTRLNELQSDWLMVWRPERSHGDRDRIGTVDPAWYAEPKLIDVGSLTATAVASLQQSKAGEGSNGVSKGGYNGDKTVTTTSSSCCSGGIRRCCARSSVIKFFCSTFPVRFVFSIGVAIGKFARSVGRLSSRVLTQPLDRIAAYFGETIAFYFAWLEFYTQWLVVPSVIGVLLFVWQLYYGSLDVAWSPIFSLFMAIWSILFLEFWKRRNAELAQRWGVLHYEDEEVVRPQFIGEWKQDASTGEMVRIYPAWRRAAKYAIVTVPFVLLWVLGILYLMVFVYAVRDQMLYQFEIHEAISRTRTAIMSNATLASFVSAVPEDISIDIQKSIISAWRGGILQFLRGEAREQASELHELDPLSYLARAGLLLGPNSTSVGGGGGGGGVLPQVTSFVASSQPSPTPLPGLSSGFSLDHLHVDLNKLSSYFQSNDDWRWWLVMVLPPISLGLLMPMIDYLFGALAYKLNEWENHATESHFRNHRIAKVFFFRFSVSFTSLFYYAFSPQQSAMQLSVQLATFLVVGQVWSKFLDVVLPLVWRRVREFKFARRLQHAEDSGLTEGRRGRRLMRHAKQQAWVESRMPQYDSFDDYAQMLMQFGYVTFFSWAFPLAPACALINNLIEMRSDGFKLCHLAQRPLAFKSGGIGVWYNVLVAMSMLAVLTNCAHLALSATNLSGSAASYFLPDWNLTETQKIFIVFVCEHVVLSLRLVMPYIVPPVPQKVKRRLERDNYALARLQGRRSLGNL